MPGKHKDNRTQRERDFHAHQLEQVMTRGHYGRVRFMSSKGFGFLLELDEDGNETGGDFFFHAKTCVATNSEHPWDVYKRLFEAGAVAVQASGNANQVYPEQKLTFDDWGPLVRFIPDKPSAKGNAAASVWVPIEQEALALRDAIFGEE